MDPITMLTTAISVIKMLGKAAQGAGLIGEDPSAYLKSAAECAERSMQIVLSKLSGSTDYDDLTADEIEHLFKGDIDMIEAEAKARIAGGA